MQIAEEPVSLIEVLSDEDVRAFISAALRRPYDHEEFLPKAEEFQRKALQVANYRCIQTHSYLTSRISKNPFYNDLVPHLPEKTILDIGCCFGTDMRRMIIDGAHPERMLGVDLIPQFFDLGFDLFEDKERLPENLFIYGNFTETDFIARIHENMLKRNFGRNSFDLIQLGAVLHLLEEKGVADLLSLIHGLLGENGILIGQTVGETCAGVASSSKGDLRFLHSSDSLAVLLSDLGYSHIEIETSENHWPLWKEAGTTRRLLYFRGTKMIK